MKVCLYNAMLLDSEFPNPYKTKYAMFSFSSASLVYTVSTCLMGLEIKGAGIFIIVFFVFSVFVINLWGPGIDNVTDLKL